MLSSQEVKLHEFPLTIIGAKFIVQIPTCRSLIVRKTWDQAPVYGSERRTFEWQGSSSRRGAGPSPGTPGCRGSWVIEEAWATPEVLTPSFDMLDFRAQTLFPSSSPTLSPTPCTNTRRCRCSNRPLARSTVQWHQAGMDNGPSTSSERGRCSSRLCHPPPVFPNVERCCTPCNSMVELSCSKDSL